MKKISLIVVFLLCILNSCCSQSRNSKPFLSNLTADANTPLYTTYAAALERSEFTLDEGYHFVFYDSTRGLCFTTDSAGDWCIAFRRGATIKYKLQEMERRITVSVSYPDLVTYSFSPFSGVTVEAAFLILNSRTALQDIELRNEGKQRIDLDVVCFLKNETKNFKNVQVDKTRNAIAFEHTEPPDQWVIEHNIPYVEKIQDVFLSSISPDRLSILSQFDPSRLFSADNQVSQADSAKVVAFQKTFSLIPGTSERFRIVRAVAPANDDRLKLFIEAKKALNLDLQDYLHRNEELFSKIPHLSLPDEDHQLLYWNAFTLIRQCLLPSEGKCHYNYYVFSREPQWGWGHGGQVFHESLSMLAYVLMDSASALNSQRVFIERQQPDGYINYRTGPYLDETIPYNDQLTTSAPWFNWENWELYKRTQDKKFLAEAYQAGKSFYQYWLKTRDEDGDGLCEWGAHAVLESVRDGKVAVWDQVCWPSNFEALDLNCMLVQEARSLFQMARELRIPQDLERWKAEVEQREGKINKYMWDEKTNFYYHVEKKNHSYSYKKEDDLKRQEIIGFLPLWAGVANQSQAAALVKTLTDTTKFWRKYGIPTLAADDPYYDPQGYWNGPIWVEWQYLIFRGLLNYGYNKEARELAEKVFAAVLEQLKTNHSFWELYSPDSPWAGWHRSYIWTGIVARMLFDLSNP